jgi:hypothetical protein
MNQDQINELNRQHRIERAKRYYRELAEALENNPSDEEA